MQRLLVPLALLAVTASASAQTPDAIEDPAMLQRYQATITPSELAGQLYVYADDYLAGRDTGEPGQRFAAKYLAGQYAAMGIAPKGTGTAENYSLAPYLQEFALTRTQTVSLSYTATRDGETVLSGCAPAAEGELVELFPVFGEVQSDDEPAPLMWVGDASEVDGMDVSGAYVLATVADNNAIQSVSMDLLDRGARGVLLPATPAASFLQRMAGDLTRPQLSLGSDEDAMDGAIFLTGLDVAATLMGTKTSTTEALHAVPLGDTGARLSITTERETGGVTTENVLAFIEGSDPDLKDEVVILSAHLDHIGTKEEGDDRIHNGADDDGSGTVALLEIAEAFQHAVQDGNGPRRSVLFLHVTGEEKGLFGSAYYADVDPQFPLENTVANLNIDMIGRYDPERGFETTEYVYIIGGGLISQDLHDWNATVNEISGTSLFLSDRFNSPDDPNQFYRRSDHWNFGKQGIPFIFYFTGTHEDYHGVGDSADKIDYERLARISRLIFGTAWHAANTDARPQVSGTGFD
ncbi:MAG: M28 family peptidase [Bacteroidota bacterium]